MQSHRNFIMDFKLHALQASQITILHDSAYRYQIPLL